MENNLLEFRCDEAQRRVKKYAMRIGIVSEAGREREECKQTFIANDRYEYRREHPD